MPLNVFFSFPVVHVVWLFLSCYLSAARCCACPYCSFIWISCSCARFPSRAVLLGNFSFVLVVPSLPAPRHPLPVGQYSVASLLKKKLSTHPPSPSERVIRIGLWMESVREWNRLEQETDGCGRVFSVFMNFPLHFYLYHKLKFII